VSRERARSDAFERLRQQLEGLLAKSEDVIAHRATAVALLHHKVPGVSWTGFYMLRGGELVVDAYQGPVACQVLEAHTGVCWAGVDRRETILVSDVRSFPGHIACDSRSRSEIVVPVHDSTGGVVGILDVDSHLPNHFDEVHRHGYETMVNLLEGRWRELGIEP
jgi:GAF domain-containing protein